MSTETRALYEAIAAGDVAVTPETTEPLREELEALDIGDYALIRGRYFTDRDSPYPFPVGHTGTVLVRRASLVLLALHRFPVTGLVSLYDLERLEEAELSAIPADKALTRRKGSRKVFCPYCRRAEILFVADIEENRAVLGWTEDGGIAVDDARVVRVSPERPRLFCTSCSHEWLDHPPVTPTPTRPS